MSTTAPLYTSQTKPPPATSQTTSNTTSRLIPQFTHATTNRFYQSPSFHNQYAFFSTHSKQYGHIPPLPHNDRPIALPANAHRRTLIPTHPRHFNPAPTNPNLSVHKSRRFNGLDASTESPSINPHVTLYSHGQTTFDSILHAIGQAEVEVLYEAYTFDLDVIGTQVFNKLVEAASRGVFVVLVYDVFGSSSLNMEQMEPLIKAGGRVVQFNPVLKPWAWNRSPFFRNHRKSAVIDGLIGFTGGMNTTDEYVSGNVKEHGKSFKDFHTRIIGPSTLGMRDVFRDTLSEANSPTLHELPTNAQLFDMVLNYPVYQSFLIEAAKSRQIANKDWISQGWMTEFANMGYKVLIARAKGLLAVINQADSAVDDLSGLQSIYTKPSLFNPVSTLSQRVYDVKKLAYQDTPTKSGYDNQHEAPEIDDNQIYTLFSQAVELSNREQLEHLQQKESLQREEEQQKVKEHRILNSAFLAPSLASSTKNSISPLHNQTTSQAHAQSISPTVTTASPLLSSTTTAPLLNPILHNRNPQPTPDDPLALKKHKLPPISQPIISSIKIDPSLNITVQTNDPPPLNKSKKSSTTTTTILTSGKDSNDILEYNTITTEDAVSENDLKRTSIDTTTTILPTPTVAELIQAQDKLSHIHGKLSQQQQQFHSQHPQPTSTSIIQMEDATIPSLNASDVPKPFTVEILPDTHDNTTITMTRTTTTTTPPISQPSPPESTEANSISTSSFTQNTQQVHQYDIPPISESIIKPTVLQSSRSILRFSRPAALQFPQYVHAMFTKQSSDKLSPYNSLSRLQQHFQQVRKKAAASTSTSNLNQLIPPFLTFPTRLERRFQRIEKRFLRLQARLKRISQFFIHPRKSTHRKLLQLRQRYLRAKSIYGDLLELQKYALPSKTDKTATATATKPTTTLNTSPPTLPTSTTTYPYYGDNYESIKLFQLGGFLTKPSNWAVIQSPPLPPPSPIQHLDIKTTQSSSTDTPPTPYPISTTSSAFDEIKQLGQQLQHDHQQFLKQKLQGQGQGQGQPSNTTSKFFFISSKSLRVLHASLRSLRSSRGLYAEQMQRVLSTIYHNVRDVRNQSSFTYQVLSARQAILDSKTELYGYNKETIDGFHPEQHISSPDFLHDPDKAPTPLPIQIHLQKHPLPNINKINTNADHNGNNQPKQQDQQLLDAVSLKDITPMQLQRHIEKIYHRVRLPQYETNTQFAAHFTNIPAQVLSSNVWTNTTKIQNYYVRAIKSATRSIYITNPYVVPPRWLKKELFRAANRGVQVHLLLSGSDANDVPHVRLASLDSYQTYVNHNIHIYEYSKRKLHAKVMVVDGLHSCVGSFNLDPYSINVNLETTMVFPHNSSVAHALVSNTLREIKEPSTKHISKSVVDQWPQYWRFWVNLAYLISRIVYGMIRMRPIQLLVQIKRFFLGKKKLRHPQRPNSRSHPADSSHPPTHTQSPQIPQNDFDLLTTPYPVQLFSELQRLQEPHSNTSLPPAQPTDDKETGQVSKNPRQSQSYSPNTVNNDIFTYKKQKQPSQPFSRQDKLQGFVSFLTEWVSPATSIPKAISDDQERTPEYTTSSILSFFTRQLARASSAILSSSPSSPPQDISISQSSNSSSIPLHRARIIRPTTPLEAAGTLRHIASTVRLVHKLNSWFARPFLSPLNFKSLYIHPKSLPSPSLSLRFNLPPPRIHSSLIRRPLDDDNDSNQDNDAFNQTLGLLNMNFDGTFNSPNTAVHVKRQEAIKNRKNHPLLPSLTPATTSPQKQSDTSTIPQHSLSSVSTKPHKIDSVHFKPTLFKSPIRNSIKHPTLTTSSKSYSTRAGLALKKSPRKKIAKPSPKKQTTKLH